MFSAYGRSRYRYTYQKVVWSFLPHITISKSICWSTQSDSRQLSDDRCASRYNSVSIIVQGLCEQVEQWRIEPWQLGFEKMCNIMNNSAAEATAFVFVFLHKCHHFVCVAGMRRLTGWSDVRPQGGQTKLLVKLVKIVANGKGLRDRLMISDRNKMTRKLNLLAMLRYLLTDSLSRSNVMNI